MNTQNLLKSGLELIKTLAFVFIIAFLLKTFLIQTFVIEGQSMEPNFHNGEYLLIDELTYHFKQPSRGDIVILIPPDDTQKNYIKRVIALPGENVEIVNNQVIVNSKVIDEPYLRNGEQTLINDSKQVDYQVALKNDEYFVLGDNRRSSRDSRSIGTVPSQNIVGRTLLVVLPFKNFHLIHHLSYAGHVPAI